MPFPNFTGSACVQGEDDKSWEPYGERFAAAACSGLFHF